MAILGLIFAIYLCVSSSFS